MSQNNSTFEAIAVDYDGSVATVKLPGIKRRAEAIARGTRANEYRGELAEVLDRLRYDDDVRVIVVTGEEDGVFLTSGGAIPFLMDDGPDRGYARIDTLFDDFMNIIRHTQLLVEMEKPIIAKVNGEAWGPGQSIMFSCDIIVADETARVGDSHMAFDELEPMVERRVYPPSDGGAVFAPLCLSPNIAKEYLMLGRVFTAAELAQLGVINYAAPLSDLDDIVDGLVERLLKRPPEILALTKRLANRNVVDQMNRTLDTGIGYGAMIMYRNAVSDVRASGEAAAGDT